MRIGKKKKLSSSTKSLHRALTTTRKKNLETVGEVGELSKVCSQVVLKCLYLARIGRPDILWSVTKLARAVTKWTRACARRLARLISYTHYTRDFKQYCHVGNTAQQCRLALFQDSDFARDLENSKSTSGGTLCICGSHTLVLTSWMYKKQTSVSHSSRESEVISLDASLRMDGIPALDFSSSNQVQDHVNRAKQSKKITSKQTKIQNKQDNMDLVNVDYVASNAKPSRSGTMLYIFEDDEAVIKMIIKGRSPAMRHVSRTHRVALGRLFDRINIDPKIQIKYI